MDKLYNFQKEREASLSKIWQSSFNARERDIFFLERNNKEKERSYWKDRRLSGAYVYDNGLPSLPIFFLIHLTIVE